MIIPSIKSHYGSLLLFLPTGFGIFQFFFLQSHFLCVHLYQLTWKNINFSFWLSVLSSMNAWNLGYNPLSLKFLCRFHSSANSTCQQIDQQNVAMFHQMKGVVIAGGCVSMYAQTSNFICFHICICYRFCGSLVASYLPMKRMEKKISRKFTYFLCCVFSIFIFCIFLVFFFIHHPFLLWIYLSIFLFPSHAYFLSHFILVYLFIYFCACIAFYFRLLDSRDSIFRNSDRTIK